MPLSPRAETMGFLPINRSTSRPSGDTDIPLTQVPTAGSTGARRYNQTLGEMSTVSSHVSEKKAGLFHRKSTKHEGDGGGDGGVIGRRKAVKTLEEQGRKGTWGDDMGLNAMGRLYNKVVNFSPITRYLVYVAPVALLLAIPIIVLGVTHNIENIRVGGAKGTNAPRLFYLFLWIEVSWLSLWGGKIVAILLPSVFMFFCGVVSTGTRKYATVIRNLEMPISLLLWALASWLVFKYKFTDDSYTWVYVIVRILGSLWVSSCVLLGEKFIIQLISISYHQRSFANRIRESKREIYLLGLMYDASRTLFPMYCEEFAEEDYVISDSIEAMLVGNKKRRRRGHKKSGSVTPINAMNLVGGVGRFGDKITSVFGNLASEITGKQMFNPNSAHSVVIEALEKVRSSEALARRIWMSFVVEGKDSLYQEDVTEVLGPGHREEAEECFEAIDADENGDISLDEMVRKVVEIGKERKAINNSMKDIGQALGVLDSILLFIVLLIVVIIFLSFFQSSFVSTLSSAGTALISLSFAISTTCQEFLGSIIFLFVKHPYDVGDRVDINGERLIVEKISLLYTIFTDLKEMQVTQTPNIILNNLWIDNLSRSKAMKEVIDVNVSFDTSFEDVELLRLEMEKFVRHADNSRDFQPDLVIGVGSVGDCDKLTLSMSIRHKSNWHNEAVRATRRSKFMCALALALRKVPIYAPGGGGTTLGSSDNPTYSVAVDDEFAKDARTKAADAADASRMVPRKATKASAKKPSGADSIVGREERPQHVSEQQAVAELTARPVLMGLDSDYGYNRDRSVDRGMGSPTLHSREASTERTENIEQIRKSLQEDLLSRHSTRGRRKAGETVPAAPLGEGQPGISLTEYDSRGNAILGATSNRTFSYDVVNQDDSQPNSVHGTPYIPSPRIAEAAHESFVPFQVQDGRLAQSPPAVMQQQPSSFSLAGRELTPTNAATGRPMSATLVPGQVTGQPMAQASHDYLSAAAGASSGSSHPNYLAPTASAPSSSQQTYGARTRGRSVSSVAEEEEPVVRGAKKQYTK